MTMKAELITLLQRRWVTPIVALEEVRCFSLAQRCSEFRRDGLTVLDKWVELPSGKKIKAYRLVGAK